MIGPLLLLGAVAYAIKAGGQKLTDAKPTYRRRRRRKPAPTPAPTPAPAPTPVPVPVAVPVAVPAPPPPIVVPKAPAAPTTIPWPQVLPAGLPPFPGSGWVPDSPPGAGVATRAAQLLLELWSHGEGTHKTEQTAGRWITYRATRMGEKKGVVAYRLASSATVPKAVPASTTPTVSPKSPLSLPTLRRGSRGSDVVTLQKRLGVGADGIFGPGTQSAVIAYQSSHGLTPDGVVGPKTWGSLFSVQA